MGFFLSFWLLMIRKGRDWYLSPNVGSLISHTEMYFSARCYIRPLLSWNGYLKYLLENHHYSEVHCVIAVFTWWRSRRGCCTGVWLTCASHIGSLYILCSLTLHISSLQKSLFWESILSILNLLSHDGGSHSWEGGGTLFRCALGHGILMWALQNGDHCKLLTVPMAAHTS